jgi:hypothetical protein
MFSESYLIVSQCDGLPPRWARGGHRAAIRLLNERSMPRPQRPESQAHARATAHIRLRRCSDQLASLPYADVPALTGGGISGTSCFFDPSDARYNRTR